MPANGLREGGKKHKHAYNSYVQRDRLNKFYDRKKVHTKYKRAIRFEERSQGAPSGVGGSGKKSSLALKEVWERDVDEEAEEYERKLSLSYGSSAVESKSERDTVKDLRLKKRRRQDLAAAAAVGEVKKVVEAQESPQRSRKKRKAGGQTDAAEAAPLALIAKPGKALEVQSPAPSNVGPEQKVEKNKKKKFDRKQVPDRYAKDLREFNSKKDAEAQERQRRYDEEVARKRQRKDTARGRAMKGQKLSQRTQWGQPKMSRMLEDITSKLGVEHQQQRQKQHGHQRALGGLDRAR